MSARARLKPQIGAVGEFGIPLREELELRLEPPSADEKYPRTPRSGVDFAHELKQSRDVLERGLSQ
jgi:hypothetical protein